jgi:hypothetical protein
MIHGIAAISQKQISSNAVIIKILSSATCHLQAVSVSMQLLPSKALSSIRTGYCALPEKSLPQSR